MDKPSASGTKKRGHKLMGKLFRRISKKSEGAEEGEDGKVCEFSCRYCLVPLMLLFFLLPCSLW